jgi:hypothetical protein
LRKSSTVSWDIFFAIPEELLHRHGARRHTKSVLH